jgi:hypothetical protein
MNGRSASAPTSSWTFTSTWCDAGRAGARSLRVDNVRCPCYQDPCMAPYRTEREPSPDRGSMKQLAARGRERLRAKERDEDAARQSERSRRLPHAVLGDNALTPELREVDHWTTLVILIGALSGIAAFPLVFVAGWKAAIASVVIGCALIVLVIARRGRRETANQQAVAAALTFPSTLPFPLDGLADWLAFGGDLRLELRATIDRETLAGAVAGVEPKASLSWRDETSVTVTLPRNYLYSTGPDSGVFGGSFPLITTLAKDLLIPLHRDVGIVRAELTSHDL